MIDTPRKPLRIQRIHIINFAVDATRAQSDEQSDDETASNRLLLGAAEEKECKSRTAVTWVRCPSPHFSRGYLMPLGAERPASVCCAGALDEV